MTRTAWIDAAEHSYCLDLNDRTVLVRHADGEVCDLNAGGEPCESDDDLAAFIRELTRMGAYGPAVEAELLAQVG